LIFLAAAGAFVLVLQWLGVFEVSTEGISTIPPGKIYIKSGKVYRGSSNEDGAKNFDYAKDHDRNNGSYFP
jgi:hypothetical protein